MNMKYINIPDLIASDALQQAIKSGNENAVQTLITTGRAKALSMGEDFSIPFTDFDESALLCAVRHNNTNIVKILLENAAHPFFENFLGETSFMLAAVHGNKKIVKLLLQYGVNINNKNTYDETTLTYLLKENNYSKNTKDIIEFLLTEGMNLTTINDEKLLHSTIIKLLEIRVSADSIYNSLINYNSHLDQATKTNVIATFFDEDIAITDSLSDTNPFVETELAGDFSFVKIFAKL